MNDNILSKCFVDHAPARILNEIAILWTKDYIYDDIGTVLWFYYYEIYNDDNFIKFLYLTGYLTVVDGAFYDIYKNFSFMHDAKSVAIPNMDVHAAFERKIKSLFEKIFPNDQKSDFFELFWKADAQGLEKLLNERMFSSADIRDYYFSAHFYYAILQFIFQPKYKVLSNLNTEKNVFELLLHDTDSRSAAIIEIKRADYKEELDKCAQTTLEQIADRQHDEQLKVDGCERILHWALVHDGNIRKMAARIVTSS